MSPTRKIPKVRCTVQLWVTERMPGLPVLVGNV